MARKGGLASSYSIDTFSRISFFDRTLDFELADGGTVRGRVTFKDGKPASGAVVRVKPRKLLWTLPLTVLIGYADSDGRYVLEHVPDGEVSISVGSTEQ